MAELYPSAAPPPVVFLMGATATGKTDLAAALYDHYHAELVSVDAAQIYRGMDIGTGKPNREFLRAYPHHLIDIRDPSEAYSAAQFRQDALAVIGEIQARHRVPILVGGSMFYFHALQHGLAALPAADRPTRARLRAEIAANGAAAAHARLRQIDPQLAATIRPTDPQRIARALEIHHLTGRPPSQLFADNAATPAPFVPLKLGWYAADRALLHRRIATRFGDMLARGLVDEVRAIVAAIPAAADPPPALRTVGYRQIHNHLRGECSHQEMTDRAIAATRQLAKRQLTWMRRQADLIWQENTGPAAALAHLNTHLPARYRRKK